jgi:hypothetical protein
VVVGAAFAIPASPRQPRDTAAIATPPKNFLVFIDFIFFSGAKDILFYPRDCQQDAVLKEKPYQGKPHFLFYPT